MIDSKEKEAVKSNLFELVKPYKGWVAIIVVLAVAGNALNLVLPKIIGHGVDAFIQNTFLLSPVIWQFSLAAFFVFACAYGQSIVQTYTAELVAKDLREKLSGKISRQSYSYIEQVTPSKLLTNLTSDVDAVKLFVSQVIASIISSLVIIIGASILLLLINWRLGLAVLTIIPLISGLFFFIFKKISTLFVKSQEVIDWLNRVINESILGSALVRVLNSQTFEHKKFFAANADAKNVGLQIVNLFVGLIPTIMFFANMATLTILSLGGYFVISGSMTLGDFAAFITYMALLIFPIIVIGFTSNIMARAQASYGRVNEVLTTEERKETGTLTPTLRGDISLKDVSVQYGQKNVLKDVSFEVKAGSKTAIIGPTAAGKTQLLYLLTGLLQPTKGVIEYDGHNINDYEQKNLHKQVGFVFQDSIIFNMSLRENIAFSDTVSDEDLKKAIATAELADFIETLPHGLETIISERGTSLSGGQKQRIMLARALALNPKILLLDDFTARVDNNTEQKVLKNIEANYPNITLLSITQKIASIENYDHVIVLMEGEVIAEGTHQELMKTSPEYVQIFDSQKSTNRYELHT